MLRQPYRSSAHTSGQTDRVLAVSAHGPHAERLAVVEKAFRSLSERYLGADPGFVRCTQHGARVHKGGTRRRPDVHMSTDATTWLRLRNGELSGIDAFTQRSLTVTGNLDFAIAFEGLFRLVGGRPPLLRIRDVPVGRQRISTLTMGSGPDVLLLHGLGGTRASLLETAATLSTRYTVHAPDLPGFGSSAKPATGRYNAAWFADCMLGLLDALDVDHAHVVGNSMGGRIAIEMALQRPDRVSALGLLCPAVAWIRRGFHPIVRLLRPELGMLPHNLNRGMVASQFSSLFYDRDRLDPAVGDLMVDEFRRIYHSAGARYAFLASARNIYLEAPHGRRGGLIPAAFSRQVRKWLPTAEQVILPDCGHVPQVERPRETNELLMDFFARIEQLAAGRTADATPLRGPGRRAA
jgi:pimeloyl-ACP methyl ester carboxylesterase/putative sterol carrier protein